MEDFKSRRQRWVETQTAKNKERRANDPHYAETIREYERQYYARNRLKISQQRQQRRRQQEKQQNADTTRETTTG